MPLSAAATVVSPGAPPMAEASVAALAWAAVAAGVALSAALLQAASGSSASAPTMMAGGGADHVSNSITVWIS